MIAIFKREWKAYFQNIIGWLFIAAIIALYGLYFLVYNLRSGYPYISYPLSSIAFILLLAVPVLTMRSLAEERHSRTDQLVLTAPISVGKLVLGKFLAMAAIFSVAMAVICISPLILSAYGTVPMGESYVAILGFWLYGLACIAVGMFLSSITESQVIAAVLTFAALFVAYMMSGICNLISSSGNLLTKILGAYDFYTPLDGFMSGCLDVTSLVYFVTVIGMALFLCCQSIQKRRYSVSAKKLTMGMFSAGMIVAGFVVAVGVNLVVRELPTEWTSIDATSTKLYSLTDDTKEFVNTLESDVTIYVLASEKNADETLAGTLERYEGLSNHITVDYVNPSVNPMFYQQYTDSAPTSNSLIVVSDNRSRVIDYSDIYEYSYDYTSYSSTVTGYDAEGQITSALQYVTMDTSELPVIYEITGHGETSVTGEFADAVEKANMTLTELTLLSEEKIPDDAAAIIINGPTSDFSEDDVQKVIAYLENGGKALITCTYEHQDLERFNTILSEYGVERVAGIVMENDGQRYYPGSPYYLLPDVSYSDYTSSVSGSYIFAPLCEGYTYPSESDDLTYTTLLATSDSAVAKADAANVTTSQYEDGDTMGPLAVALAVEKTVDDDNTMQLVVAGSPLLFTDSADEIVSGNNLSMFTDILGSLVDSDADSTSVIPVKEYELGTITVTSVTTLIGGLAGSILIPLALIITGIVIWAVRRKK